MGKWPSLDKIEMEDVKIDKDDYEDKIDELQHRLLDLQIHGLRTGRRVLMGIDGWDAAGKGGLIERIFDARCEHDAGRCEAILRERLQVQVGADFAECAGRAQHVAACRRWETRGVTHAEA